MPMWPPSATVPPSATAATIAIVWKSIKSVNTAESVSGPGDYSHCRRTLDYYYYSCYNDCHYEKYYKQKESASGLYNYSHFKEL